jgi:hypothetical protein
MVEALQNALLAHAQGNPLRRVYSIAGRSMEFRDIADVEASLKHWQAEVSRLTAATRIAAGLQPQGRLSVRL